MKNKEDKEEQYYIVKKNWNGMVMFNSASSRGYIHHVIYKWINGKLYFKMLTPDPKENYALIKTNNGWSLSMSQVDLNRNITVEEINNNLIPISRDEIFLALL